MYEDDSDSSEKGKDSKKKCLPFTKREIKFLHKGVSQFGMGSWEKILKEFNFQEGRTAVSCRKKFLYTQDNPPRTLESESDDDSYPQPKRPKKPIPFTRQEIQWVWDGVQIHGTNWRKILRSYQFQPGRTAKSLEHKYYRFIKKNPPKKDVAHLDVKPSGRFSEDECKYLMEGVGKYGNDSWDRILKEYAFEDGRTTKDLKEKHEFLEAQRNASLMNGANGVNNLNNSNGVNNVSVNVNGMHMGMHGSMNTGINIESMGNSSVGLMDTNSSPIITMSNGLMGTYGSPMGPVGGSTSMDVKSSIIGSTQNILDDPMKKYDSNNFSMRNPTPITPLSPYDDGHMIGTFSGNGMISIGGDIESDSMQTEEQQFLSTQSIDDYSDYESDYDEYEPTPLTMPSMNNTNIGMNNGINNANPMSDIMNGINNLNPMSDISKVSGMVGFSGIPVGIPPLTPTPMHSAPFLNPYQNFGSTYPTLYNVGSGNMVPQMINQHMSQYAVMPPLHHSHIIEEEEEDYEMVNEMGGYINRAQHPQDVNLHYMMA